MRCVWASACADETVSRFTGAFAVKREKKFLIWGVDSGYHHRFLNRLNLPLLLASSTIQFTYREKGLPLEIIETQQKYSKDVYSSQGFSTVYKVVIIKLPCGETVQNTAWWLAYHGYHHDNVLQSQGKSLFGKGEIKRVLCFR
jgi:hypothetical protein